jgi:hypothetical protein
MWVCFGTRCFFRLSASVLPEHRLNQIPDVRRIYVGDGGELISVVTDFVWYGGCCTQSWYRRQWQSGGNGSPAAVGSNRRQLRRSGGNCRL